MGAGRNQYLVGSWTSLQTHFQVRVMFAHYYFASSVAQYLGIYIDTTYYSNNTVPNQTLSGTVSGSNNPNLGCSSPSSTAVQTVFDQSYTHSAAGLTLKIATSDPTATDIYWGIK